MVKVVSKPVTKRTQSVGFGWAGERAEPMTEARVMPPMARPIPKARPTHPPTAASRTCEPCRVNNATGTSAASSAAASPAASGISPSTGGTTGTTGPTEYTPDLTVAVTAAKPIKIGTATNERGDRREKPHKP
eukprot:scaffold5226_cov100-Isochrysis_galbana.AAC.4